MQYLLLSFLALLSLPISVIGQNLVPNPSFEEYSNCPTYDGQIYLLSHWNRPDNTTGTPDYYHTCYVTNPPLGSMDIPHNWTGYQPTHTGNGYVGIYNFGYEDLREYIQTELIEPLEAGKYYQVEMYVNTSNYGGIAIDEIGIHFSENKIYGDGTYKPLDVIPQVKNPSGNILTDTAGWTLISDLYLAEGGEQYITIGNFKTDSMTQHIIFDPGSYLQGYTFIDDVSVVKMDTVLNTTEGFYSDSNFKIYPNPANDYVTIESKRSNCNPCCISIYSVDGKQLTNEIKINCEKTLIYFSEFNSGSYILKFKNKSGTIISASKLIKH